MALKGGYSKKTISDNIAQMLKEGMARNRAVAIALNMARDAYKKKHPHGFPPMHIRTREEKARTGRGQNPVPPSSHLQEIEQASRLYEKFSGHEAEEIGTIDKPDVPDVLIAVGEVDGILYSTVRDGQLEKYIHHFRKNSRPLFCVSPDGKQLFMLGGAYDFTERGIVDNG